MLRPSLLLLVLAVWVAPLFGAVARGKTSVAAWAKAKGKMKAEPAAAASRVDLPAPAAASSPSPESGRGKAKNEGGGGVSGKVAVVGFTGNGAGRVHQVVVSALRTRGLQVTTNLRPVDSAEQYREMAATLQLAAYIEGDVKGDGPQGRATVHVRSGVTGRRIASVRFSGDRNKLASDVSNELWPRTGSKLTRLCHEAAKPRKRGGRGPMRIDAGTQLESTVQDDSDVPRHLRTGKRRDDPWAADDGK